MWAHRHYTLFSGTADILWVLQTEEMLVKAARSFDNWELYKFQNPHRKILSFPPCHCVFWKAAWRPHCEGDKSFDINHCVKVKGIQSSAQEEEPLIACIPPALWSSVLQIKQQLLHTAEPFCVRVCACSSRICACLCLFAYPTVCPCMSRCKVTLASDVHVRWGRGVFPNPAISKITAPCIFNIPAPVRGPEFRAGRPISSDQQCCVVFFFSTVHHTREHVCLQCRDAWCYNLPWVVMHELLAKHCCCCCCCVLC